MRRFLRLVGRDVRIAYSGGTAWLPIVFYLAVASLFPFAVGPDRALLLRTGGSIIWIAALLASLLPIDQLVRPDIEAGVIDQLVLRGFSEEVIALAKFAAHWLGFAPPLLLATIIAAALMGLGQPDLLLLLAGLALASPALAGLALITATLTAGLGGAGAISGLIVIPLALPVLIFGTGLLGADGAGALKLLTASSLLIVAITPFAAGAALRAGRG